MLKKKVKNRVLQKLFELKILGDPSRTGQKVYVDHVPSIELGVPPLKEEGIAAMATPPKVLVEPQQSPPS